MGAEYRTKVLPGDLTKEQQTAKFNEMQDPARHEHGNSYSGDWNMCNGLIIHEGVLNL
jgi:hypothetical protein